MTAKQWRAAIGVSDHYLPMYRDRDPRTGLYAIARRADGKLEACSAPGVWATLRDQAYWETQLRGNTMTEYCVISITEYYGPETYIKWAAGPFETIEEARAHQGEGDQGLNSIGLIELSHNQASASAGVVAECTCLGDQGNPWECLTNEQLERARLAHERNIKRNGLTNARAAEYWAHGNVPDSYAYNALADDGQYLVQSPDGDVYMIRLI